MDAFEQRYTAAEKALQTITNFLTREVEQELPEGVTLPQVFLLRLVGERQGITVSAVSKLMGVTPSAITLLADRLKAAGWLVRERDERDRRIVHMRLTAAGQTVLADLKQKHLSIMRRYVGRLSDEEQEQMLSIYTKLAAIVQEAASNKKEDSARGTLTTVD